MYHPRRINLSEQSWHIIDELGFRVILTGICAHIPTRFIPIGFPVWSVGRRDIHRLVIPCGWILLHSLIALLTLGPPVLQAVQLLAISSTLMVTVPIGS
uniref:Uncharacterized protein n=1 Tax=Strigamia maritima TaxID=126957 RepID=T1IHL1_STRMM